jgi:hypothetical protein
MHVTMQHPGTAQHTACAAEPLTWKEAQQSEQDVDAQLTATATLQGHCHWRQEQRQQRSSAGPG